MKLVTMRAQISGSAQGATHRCQFPGLGNKSLSLVNTDHCSFAFDMADGSVLYGIPVTAGQGRWQKFTSNDQVDHRVHTLLQYESPEVLLPKISSYTICIQI